MILCDWQLKKWARGGGLNPFEASCINPASVDLRWSGRFRLAQIEGWGPLITVEDGWVFKPGLFYLLDTLETASMPSACAGFLALKSSLGRRGLEHLHAGWVDPGFRGTLTLEVAVRAPWDVELVKGESIVQLILERLEKKPSMVYSGHYQDQMGPTEERSRNE